MDSFIKHKAPGGAAVDVKCLDWSPLNSLSAYYDMYRVEAIASIYNIHVHTDVMSDVVLENTCDINYIF